MPTHGRKIAGSASSAIAAAGRRTRRRGTSARALARPPRSAAVTATSISCRPRSRTARQLCPWSEKIPA